MSNLNSASYLSLFDVSMDPTLFSSDTSRTTSLAFPNLFDVSRNQVAVACDESSIVNRTRLLILTEPTELYNEPNFGVGLKRHLWQYNNQNQQAIIKDRIVAQLREHEPCVDPDKTEFADGLLFTGRVDSSAQQHDHNRLKMTVSLSTIYGENLEVNFDDIY